MWITRNKKSAPRVDAVVSGSRNPVKPVQDGNFAPGVARRVQFQAGLSPNSAVLPICGAFNKPPLEIKLGGVPK
jgi:hypothetical protein